jgi:eukaryotic-like serine/threonine-protein kinase
MAVHPDKIGKYLVTQHIGTGSTGEVYLCHDPYANHEVAVKLYKQSDQDHRSTGVFKRIFFNEAQMVGKLRHPYILPILDAGDESGDCYTVMEYVRGARTLSAFCRTENLLPVRKVLEILFKCAKALDFSHRKGVIHRDIKPNNIMMTADGDIRIVDYGIAISEDGESTSTADNIGGLTGSPSYMSPQQVRQEKLDNTSDLYSLGIVMYELLTGERPFRGDNLSRLLHQIVYATATPMHKHRPDIPPVLDEIVVRLMQKDPAKRYQTGLDVASSMILAFEELERVKEEINEQERFDLVRNLKFFHGFSYPETWEVMKASEWSQHHTGDAIISEGQIDDSFYIIVDGSVSVMKGGNALGKLEQGDCFGESGYLEKAERPITIVADTPVTSLMVNSTLIEQASLSCQLKFTKEFLRSLLSRLNRPSVGGS